MGQELGMHTFHWVLNDLLSYFILTDMATLQDFQKTHGLSADLSTAFTTTDAGELSIKSGAMIAMADIENYPYTIIFNTSDNSPILLQEGNHLQLRQDGYILQVQSGTVVLSTWHILNNFTNDAINHTLQKLKRPTLSLDNGWYQVSILGGLSKQVLDGKLIHNEPTFEFIFTKMNNKPECCADIFSSYHLII